MFEQRCYTSPIYVLPLLYVEPGVRNNNTEPVLLAPSNDHEARRATYRGQLTRMQKTDRDPVAAMQSLIKHWYQGPAGDVTPSPWQFTCFMMQKKATCYIQLFNRTAAQELPTQWWCQWSLADFALCDVLNDEFFLKHTEYLPDGIGMTVAIHIWLRTICWPAIMAEVQQKSKQTA